MRTEGVVVVDASSGERRFAAEELSAWVGAILEEVGLPADDARLAGRCLVRANLRGTDTHGVMRVPAYVDSIGTGRVNPRPRPVTREVGGLLHYDGDNGLGHAQGPHAMAQAIAALSAPTAPGFLPGVLTRVGHLGAIGVLALAAAEAGLVALVCQQSLPFMALPGATSPAIGNNPIAFACPLPGRSPLVFDTATSVVSRGGVLDAQRTGRPIPPGWAIGPDGEPTTDPATALAGSLLPMSGHKGIGLAMIVQCLAGSLGAALESQPSGALGAFVLLVDPDALGGAGNFHADMSGWLDRFLAVSGDSGRYPGERAAACEQRRAARGIPLSPAVVAELRAVSESVGLAFVSALPGSAEEVA